MIINEGLLELMRRETVCCIDTETTGLDPEEARVIEVGLVYLKQHGEMQGPVSFLFDPGVPITNSHVHGITDAMVRGKSVWDKGRWPSTDVRIYCAYNAPYDLAVLRNKHHGYDPGDDLWVDLAQLLKHRWGYKDGHKMSLAKALDKAGVIVEGDAHRAGRDALAVAQLLAWVLYG